MIITVPTPITNYRVIITLIVIVMKNGHRGRDVPPPQPSRRSGKYVRTEQRSSTPGSSHPPLARSYRTRSTPVPRFVLPCSTSPAIAVQPQRVAERVNNLVYFAPSRRVFVFSSTGPSLQTIWKLS